MINLKKKITTSLMTIIMVLSILGLNLANPQMAFAKANVQYKETVSKAIDKASVSVVKNYNSWDWVAIGLSRAGKKVPAEYIPNVKKYIKQNDGKFDGRPTEYERMTLGILAAGGNPEDIENTNLIEKIYNAKLNEQGINALVFGLIAIDAKDYKAQSYKGLKWTKDQIIDAILDDQCDNEGTKFGKKAGWAYGSPIADPDMTGMAMTALAPHANERQDVKAAIGDAADYLASIQQDNGGYTSWGTSNSESCVQVIMGLCTNGIDPTGEKFTKNGKNVVDALLSFQTDDGGFAHMIESDGVTKYTNGMATEQALYGLDQYKYFMDGKGSIYDFISNPVNN